MARRDAGARPATPQDRSARALWQAYRWRWGRRRLLARALAKRRQLRVVADRTSSIAPGAVLAFLCLRNEAQRLPYLLQHYRGLGVDHFLVVDNGSDDGSDALLSGEPDISLWRTDASYRLARFGLDWVTWLQIRHGHGHWCLTVDADELLVYPFWQTRPLPALCHELARRGRSSMAALMLDLYPKGRVGDTPYRAGDDPLDRIDWFDAGNYTIRRQPGQDSLWVQGGPRARCFFADAPRRAPTLNKLPLVFWNRRHVYLNSTHAALPPRLNRAYDDDGGEQLSGALLHTKFLDQIVTRSGEERLRGEHFANSALYDRYYEALTENPTLWTPQSTRYRGWRHLEALGLMSRGGWI
ncbi:glycosyltransferase family 2 protein [Palleronia pontilimi]|uniref:glycosyltransferase family 2 protein n=1 Tax=Palleronia pontilimi TaxID=1964209 RepID=UPI003F65D261